MIVVDLECSGVDKVSCGIIQIGAFDLRNPDNTFLMDCRLDEDDDFDVEALAISGMTESDVRDPSRISQKELLIKFFEWCDSVKTKSIICQHPAFDYGFLEVKSSKYGLYDWKDYGSFFLNYKCFDLHSIAQAIYSRINGDILLKDDLRYSNMGLHKILQFCGIEDVRQVIKNGVILKEGPPHDALGDSKLAGEAFFRLIYGKGLLPEFEKFLVPDYLKK